MATKSMKFGKNPELNFSDDPADTEGTEGIEGSKGTEGPEETEGDDANDDDEVDDDDDVEGDDVKVGVGNQEERKRKREAAVTAHAKLQLKERPKSLKKRLGYMIGNENNKEFIAVFTVMSVIGVLGLRFLAS